MCLPNLLCVPIYIYADVYMTYEYSHNMVQPEKVLYDHNPKSKKFKHTHIK